MDFIEVNLCKLSIDVLLDEQHIGVTMCLQELAHKQISASFTSYGTRKDTYFSADESLDNLGDVLGY